MKLFNYSARKAVWYALTIFVLASCSDEADCIRGRGDLETRSVTVSAFNGVRVNGSTRVFVKRGATQQVEVKGQPNVLDAINTEVQNGIWDISFGPCLRSHKTVEVYVTVPELTSADLVGSGRIEVQHQFESAEFRVSMDGSGSVKADVVANKVTSRLSGSGSIDLLGASTVHDTNISGSGSIKAFSLRTENTGVQLSGSGSAEVSATTSLTVSISGSGNVYYQGNPTINSTISGSGKVIKR